MKTGYLHRLADLIAPRLCTVCGRRLSPTEQVVCAPCYLHLPRTGFEHHAYDNMMARLFWGVVPVSRVAALFYYEAHSDVSNILYDLKYHDHPEIGVAMGQLVATEFQEAGFFSGIDALVPVPLAKVRQRHRGYNQSRCIAEGISHVTGLPVVEGAVLRTQFVKSQTQMYRWDRLQNVAHAFEARHLPTLKGLHVLLVDDVVTTGATMTACARELQKAEDVSISMLALGFAKS
jgi:ComF family protein